MDEFETALRNALDEEASTVSASPDALQEIRRRIDRGERGDAALVRRPRSPWLGTRGAVVATAAVAAAAAAVGVVLSTGGSRPAHPIAPAHTPSPSTSLVPTPTSHTRGSPVVLGYTAVAGSKLVNVTGPSSYVIRLPGNAGLASHLTDLRSPDPGLFYGIRSQGSCGADLMRIDTSAGRRADVAVTPPPGFSVTGYAIDGGRQAVVESACDGSGGRLVASDQVTNASHTVSWQGNPPTVVGNPAWAGASQLDVVWRIGTEASPVVIDPFTADRIDTGAPACGAWDPATYLAQDLQGQGSNVFVVTQSAGGTSVLRCDPTTGPSVAFRIPKTAVVATAAGQVTASGRWGVYAADAQGRLWLWRGAAGSKAHIVGNAPQGVTAIAW